MAIHIYKIYFLASDKCYIGQTCNFKRRMFRHLENKSFVGNALRKYDDWEIEILHTTKNRDTANLLEIEEIRHYNCIVPNGYNLTRGGDGGPIMFGNQHAKGIVPSKEKREKQSKMMQGNQFAKGGKGHTQKHSEEAKKKISRANKGKKRTEEFCKDLSRRTKGHKYLLGYKHSEKSKRKNKESQNRPEVRAKKAKKRSGCALKNIQIGILKRDLRKLEKELVEICPWDGT